MRLVYGVTIGIFTITAFFMFLLFNNVIRDHENDIDFINLIKTQSLLTHLITLNTESFISKSTDDKRVEIMSIVSEMQKNHNVIVNDYLSEKKNKEYSLGKEFYSESEQSFDSLITGYLNLVTGIVLNDIDEQPETIKSKNELLQSLSIKLFESYDEITNLFNQEINIHIKKARLYVVLLLLIIAFITIVIFVFIFQPLERSIKQEKIKLEERVEKRETDLVKAGLFAQGILKTVIDAIITITPEGLIQSFNPAAEKMFGYTEAEVIGHNVKMLMPEPYKAQHDQYLHNYHETGKAKIIGIGREVIAKRKDGTTFPADLAVTEINQGDYKGFVGSLRDITLRKDSEENLRQITALQKAILDGANVIIISTNVNGMIISFNACAENMLGYKSIEVVGKYTPEIIHDKNEIIERAKSLTEELNESIKPGFDTFVALPNRGEIDEHEWTYISKQGERLPVMLYITAMRDEENNITGYLGIARDLTEEKKLDRMKREFVSTVSHELRTPLTSISGSLGLVVGGAAGEIPNKALELLQVAVNNCTRLVRLINDILDMEKIESGHIDLQLQRINLIELVHEAIAANEAYTRQHKVKLRLDESSKDSYVNADRDRIIQVLTNLISNAAKFSPPQGTVTVNLQHVNRMVRLEVSDEGPGISEEFQEQLFRKFTQSDASDTRQKSGTGLGLSISKAIIEQHEGQIGFKNRAQGGTTFYFELPLRTASSLATEDTFRVETGKQRILVCEDDPDAADILRLIIEDEGFDVDISHSIENARTKIKNNNYAALTLDIIMPDMNGVSFLRELKDNVVTRELPIIVVSAIARESKNQMGAEALNVVDWLSKPVDEQRLLSEIKRAVDGINTEIFSVLHVEDDKDIAHLITVLLEGTATVDAATTLAEARDCLLERKYDLVVLDIGLPDGSGLSLLSTLSKQVPPVPVIIFSAHEPDVEISNQVTAAFTKSRTDNKVLLNTIRDNLNSISKSTESFHQS
ncbi:MAG: PAS domain S-box protein [Proteobacteria bacterium]|nr:PAS domain S-box protein [Pseudomonadota bacterium]NOG61763.1 PAS domain S-box protein [Pseudomonadota bacterium]